MTQSITSEELVLAKDLIFFIYGFTFIMLVISITMFSIGDLIAESNVYKKYLKQQQPRCHRCDKVCTKRQIGSHSEFFFCSDKNCQEPSE
jgi:hypothetical protein